MHTRGREDTSVARGVVMDEGTWEPLGWSACPVGCPGQGCLSLFDCLVVFMFMFILQCERWQTPELKTCLPSRGLRMECECKGGEGKPGGAWPCPSHTCAWFSERHWGGGGPIERPRLVTEEGGARGEPKETQGKWVCPSPHHSLPKLGRQRWGPVLGAGILSHGRTQPLPPLPTSAWPGGTSPTHGWSSFQKEAGDESHPTWSSFAAGTGCPFQLSGSEPWSQMAGGGRYTQSCVGRQRTPPSPRGCPKGTAGFRTPSCSAQDPTSLLHPDPAGSVPQGREMSTCILASQWMDPRRPGSRHWGLPSAASTTPSLSGLPQSGEDMPGPKGSFMDWMKYSLPDSGSGTY